MVCEHNDALILNDAMNTDENWTFILKIPRDRLVIVTPNTTEHLSVETLNALIKALLQVVSMDCIK